jgi:methionyl-tRNA formyltransferase
LRVIFMGTPDFAVPTLDAVLEAGHEVVLVVAQPDKPAGRGKQLRAPPVAARATALGLPLAQPRALRRGPFPEQYVALEADVAVVIAYGRILPERLLDAPLHGCVNVHASLLPRWRGAAPIQAAIRSGDTVTGVCTQRMEPSLDTGPVYATLQTPISGADTAGTLHDRLAQMSAEVCVQTLVGLGTLEAVPQSAEGITWAPKIDKSDGCVDWGQSAIDIDRQIRAFTPWPGGWIPWNKGPLKIKEAFCCEGEGAPGEILCTGPLRVACGKGAMELAKVQAPGKRPISGTDFANGARLQIGGRLAWPS